MDTPAQRSAVNARLLTLIPSLRVFFLYVFLAFWLFAQAWTNPTYLSAGAAGDPQIYMWMLGWVPYSISHGLNPLFTDYLIYPNGANLFWSLIPILPGLILTPIMSLAGPVFASNVAITAALAASAWCAYVATNAFTRDRLASTVGGLLFGFSPYMLAHSLGHINLVICVTPPLALLLMAELLVWRRRRAWVTGLALGLLAAAQLLTTPEILLTTGLVGLVGVVVLAALRPREVGGRLRHAVTGLAVAAVVFLPVAALVVGFAFLGPGRVIGIVREQDIYVTDALNFIIPTHVMLLAPSPLLNIAHAWTGDDAEWNAYVGVPLLAMLAFIAVRWWSSLMVRWAAIVAVLVALLSLGPHLHLAGRIHFHIPLPWLLLQKLPLLDNVLPSRLMLFFYLLAALALALFVKETRERGRGWKLGLGWAATALSLVVLLPAVPWPSTPNPIPPFFTSAAVKRMPQGSVALVAPFSTAPGFQVGPGQDAATNPMLWQEASGMWFRMPEGALNVPDIYGNPSGGRPPQSYLQSTMIAIQQGSQTPIVTPVFRSTIWNDLSRWKIQTVIVGPMFNQQAMIDFFRALLGRNPEQVGGVFVWWGARVPPVDGP